MNDVASLRDLMTFGCPLQAFEQHLNRSSSFSLSLTMASPTAHILAPHVPVVVSRLCVRHWISPKQTKKKMRKKNAMKECKRGKWNARWWNANTYVSLLYIRWRQQQLRYFHHLIYWVKYINWQPTNSCVDIMQRTGFHALNEAPGQNTDDSF